jgi:hypothetical protein
LPFVDLSLATKEKNDKSDTDAFYKHVISGNGGYCSYRPSIISIPAAVARTAISVPIPEKLRWSRCASPVKMSQIPSNNDPMVLFIAAIPL